MPRTNFLQKNLIDRWLQFGGKAALRQTLSFPFRFLCKKKQSIVLIVENHNRPPQTVEGAQRVTFPLIDAARRREMLSDIDAQRFRNFLDSGCLGFWIEQEGQICGHAFVQMEGIYTFGQTGAYRLPPNTAMLRNLEVYSRFRGRGLGPQLNRLRLGAIPEGYIPMGLVIPENRYALRNLQALGFDPVMLVTRHTWCRRWTRQRLHYLKETDLTRRLAEGFTH